MAIRILRVMEYIYPDVETMEMDMARWTNSSPPKNNIRYRSVSMPLETVRSTPRLFITGEEEEDGDTSVTGNAE